MANSPALKKAQKEYLSTGKGQAAKKRANDNYEAKRSSSPQVRATKLDPDDKEKFEYIKKDLESQLDKKLNHTEVFLELIRRY